MRFYFFSIVCFFSLINSSNSFGQVQSLELSDFNSSETFKKIRLQNEYAFIVFLDREALFKEQEAVIDSLSKRHGAYVDYVILKYSNSKKSEFFQNKVRSNHYMLYSKSSESLLPFYKFGTLMTGSSKHLKLSIPDCLADKYLTQLRETFIPMHDEITEGIRSDYLIHDLRRKTEILIVNNEAVFDRLDSLKSVIKGERTQLKNTFNFYLQLGTSFGGKRNLSIQNSLESTDVVTSRSSSLNLKFSISPSASLFLLGGVKNYLNLGVQFSDNQQRVEGTFHQRDSKSLPISNDLYLDIFSENFQEVLRTRVLSVPLSIRSELTGNEAYGLGTILGFQFNRLLGSRYQVVDGSLDSRAYSETNDILFENVSEINLSNDVSIADEAGEINLRFSSLNPIFGMYWERKLDTNRSFIAEFFLTPVYRFETLNTNRGMISSGNLRYHGVYNGVDHVTLPLFNLMIGFSI